MEISDAGRLRELEREKASLKRLPAEAKLDKVALKALVEGISASRPTNKNGLSRSLLSKKIDSAALLSLISAFLPFMTLMEIVWG